MADKFWDHQVGCGGNTNKLMHHNVVRVTLFDVALSVALALTREGPGVVANSQARLADILSPTWRCGCPATLDVHVIFPLQDVTLHEAAITLGDPCFECGCVAQSDLPFGQLSCCREGGLSPLLQSLWVA